jgi:phage terminase small subunit
LSAHRAPLKTTFRPNPMNLLPQQPKKERELTEKQRHFLDLLFENGGQVTQAAVDAGYSRGSAAWLRKNLADEIVERTKDVLSVNALRAANRLVHSIDNPAPERGDDLRLKAAESLLNRVGVKAPEQINHSVAAVHGVVLLPPKNEVTIDG